METEYDFITFLILTDSIKELINVLWDYNIECDEIQLSNGNAVKIKSIIRNIEKWRKNGNSFTDIMFKLVERYCPILEYYM